MWRPNKPSSALFTQVRINIQKEDDINKLILDNCILPESVRYCISNDLFQVSQLVGRRPYDSSLREEERRSYKEQLLEYQEFLKVELAWVGKELDS